VVWPRGKAKEGKRRRRSLVVRIVLGVLTTFCALVIALGVYVGISLYQIDRAVHHVQVPAALLARGQNTLLAIVEGPRHSEEAYLFHATNGHTNVLVVPTSLAITVDGRSRALSTMDIHAPTDIIAGLHKLGLPVAHYVGVDLHMVSPTSSLGRLATGNVSISGMLSDPTGTASLLEQVASHVYLGPGTPVTALLELMNVPTTKAVHVPTSVDAHGTVVLASPVVGVLRHFL
jgi:hypothetical protein